MENIKRGEIYYVAIPRATGHEVQKDRPGIVVSCDALNRRSGTVALVMCSASAGRRDLPEHVVIRSTPISSTAMCEHIYAVDKSRLGKPLGVCSRKEMDAVDAGIMAGLGLGMSDSEKSAENGPKNTGADRMTLVRAETERDTYKALYESLMDRMSMGQRKTI